MSLRALKLITTFAPAVIILALEVLRHRFFPEEGPMTIGNILIFLFILICSFFLTRFTFGIIEKAQRESNRRNQELATLNSIALAVNESLNLDVVLSRALDKLLQTTEADAAEIFLQDEHTQEMVQRVHRGLLPEGFHTKTRFMAGEGFVGSVVETGETSVVEDVSQTRWLFIDKVKESGFNSIVGVPLKSEKQVIGVIVLVALNGKRFTSEDTQLLVSIGNQIALAIEKARLHEKVQNMAALEERARIAREMHDGIAQVLGYVNTKTQAARQVLADGQPTQAEAYLKEVEEVARDTYADVREAILGLRSTEMLQKGILPLLKDYVSHFNQICNVKTELDVSDEAIQFLSPATELHVIRIIQESLTNIRKHARADRAWVRISTADGHAVVVIEDDGQGFDPTRVRRENEPRFGLQTMRERAESIQGNLEITSGQKRGTMVKLTVPLTRRVVNEGNASR